MTLLVVVAQDDRMPAATIATIAHGTTTPAFAVTPGAYIWHRGAYRLVTAVRGGTIRMGRHALHTTLADLVEVAP